MQVRELGGGVVYWINGITFFVNRAYILTGSVIARSGFFERKLR
jgi:hypothetical protein